MPDETDMVDLYHFSDSADRAAFLHAVHQTGSGWWVVAHSWGAYEVAGARSPAIDKIAYAEHGKTELYSDA